MTRKMTPDEALDLLRSLVFAYENTFVDQGEEVIERLTEDYHVALVNLQRYVDATEIEDGSEESLP
jgi:hypothetical protein